MVEGYSRASIRIEERRPAGILSVSDRCEGTVDGVAWSEARNSGQTRMTPAQTRWKWVYVQ